MSNETIKDLIIEKANSYFEETKKENSRLKSWEHCYLAFCKARDEEKPDKEYLSLMLAFYLASWGMYRGSAFILQKDYKIHIPVVQELLKKKYDCLVGAGCEGLEEKETKEQIIELSNFIKGHYFKVRESVTKKPSKTEITDTLTTKIIMGVFGCVPAYDRYFVSAIRTYKVSTGIFNEGSLSKLIKFYKDNSEDFEKARKKMKIEDKIYPQMKLIDMGFWQIGFEKEEQEKKEKEKTTNENQKQKKKNSIR